MRNEKIVKPLCLLLLVAWVVSVGCSIGYLAYYHKFAVAAGSLYVGVLSWPMAKKILSYLNY